MSRSRNVLAHRGRSASWAGVGVPAPKERLNPAAERPKHQGQDEPRNEEDYQIHQGGDGLREYSDGIAERHGHRAEGARSNRRSGFHKINSEIGQSEPLFRLRRSLLEKSAELIASCPCEAGCPSCVGPAGEVGEKAKQAAARMIQAMMADEDAGRGTTANKGEKRRMPSAARSPGDQISS